MDAIELSIVIKRPIEDAFAFLANLENDAKWRREWVETTKTSEGSLGVGATFRLVGELLGRRINGLRSIQELRAAHPTSSGASPRR